MHKSLALAAGAALCCVASAQQYHITDLGIGTANAISSNGIVVGQHFTDDGDRAFIYQGETTTVLGTLWNAGPGDINYSQAYAVNSSGVVVGWTHTPEGIRGFRYANGTMEALGALPMQFDSESRAYGINAAGQIVGFSNSDSGYKPVSFGSGGSVTALGTTGGSAAAINEAGDIAGDALFGGSPHAFRYHAGTLTDLGTLAGGTYSIANGINDAGDVVGYGDSNNGTRAFLSRAGQMIDLGATPGASMSFAYDINNLGDAVGFVDSSAFLFRGGQVLNLNGLVDSTSSGWLLQEARSINDSGQIVGKGFFNGGSHAFLATPVPEPASILVLSTASAWLACRRRKANRKA